MTGEKINVVAEKTVALLLSANRRIQFLCRDTKVGGWDRMMFHELSYGTVAIFGWPELAEKIREKLSGFGCRVLLCEKMEELMNMAAEADYFINLDKELSVDATLISKFKDGVIIVDAASACFDQNAVLAALDSDRVAAFASSAENSKTNLELNAHKNYVAFPELREEMRG